MEIHLRAIGYIADEDCPHLIIKDFPTEDKKDKTARAACRRLFGESFKLILIVGNCPMPPGRYILADVAKRLLGEK